MRSVRVTGGFSGEVEVRLTDSKGQDLSLADFKIGLVPVDGGIPEATSPTWQAVTEVEYPEQGQAVLTMRPTATHPLGRFWPHVLVIDSGRDPELIRADDYVELT
jgi:hypothetical protein